MQLIEYLPDFLQGIREYQEIFKVEDIEIKKLKAQIEKILKEAIVNTAESYGIERYEKIYNIQNNEDDISTRRFVILSKINNRLPYSLNWLRNKLDNTLGKENYTLNVDYNNYSIQIEIAALLKDIAIMINKDLREQLPANLLITVNLFQTELCKQYFAGVVHSKEYITIRQVV